MANFPSDVWVVIPAYNEAPYIESVLKSVHRYTVNIVVVNDGSSDETVDKSLLHTSYVLSHKLNLGKGAALKTGCQFAFAHLKAKAVILMDADAQHDPAELQLFTNELRKGQTLIMGVRKFSNAMPWTRRIGNHLASVCVQLLFGTYIPDIPSGYKAFTRQVYQQIEWQANDYSVELEIAVMVARHHLTFTTVPIKTIYHDTDKGMTILDTFAMLSQMFKLKIQV